MQATAAKLSVYILAGQSNMEGQAEVASKNRSTGQYLNGTLAYQLKDPRTAEQFAPLWDGATNDWTVLDDVKVWFNENGSTQVRLCLTSTVLHPPIWLVLCTPTPTTPTTTTTTTTTTKLSSP